MFISLKYVPCMLLRSTTRPFFRLCRAAHLLPQQVSCTDEIRGGTGGWQAWGEIIFKAATETFLMGRRCCSLDPIKLQRSRLSLPCPWGVINFLLRDDSQKPLRSIKGWRRTTYGKMQWNSLKPAGKIHLCRRTGCVNAQQQQSIPCPSQGQRLGPASQETRRKPEMGQEHTAGSSYLWPCQMVLEIRGKRF